MLLRGRNLRSRSGPGRAKVNVLPEHILQLDFSIRKDHLQALRTPSKGPRVQAAGARGYQSTFLNLVAWIHLA